MQTTFKQAGVIPYRFVEGEIQVLLITSSNGKRWVIPKGWKELLETTAEAAAKEAWEEAGITGTIHTPAIGTYPNRKWGYHFPVEVFLMQVEAEHTTYPESTRRKRRWMSLPQAAQRIREPELKHLLQQVPNLL